MGIIVNLGIFFVTLLLLVSVHEWGHFWVARRCGVKVLCFSIGFGKALWKTTSKAGTVIQISWFPLGGYVRLLDEAAAPVPADQRHLSFNAQPLWQRAAIVLAGPGVNFLFAMICFWGMYCIGFDSAKPVIGRIIPGSIAAQAHMPANTTITHVGGMATRSWSDVLMATVPHIGDNEPMQVTTQHGHYSLPLATWRLDGLNPDPIQALGWMPKRTPIAPIIAHIKSHSPAARSGLKAGDRITSINQTPIEDWRQLITHPALQQARPLTLEIQRNGARLPISLTPEKPHWLSRRPALGLAVRTPTPTPALIVHQQQTPLSAIGSAWDRTWQYSHFHLIALGKLITGKLSLLGLGGPITIYNIAHQAFKQGAALFLRFLGILNTMLAVVNLLPIPGLDGGHLIYLAIEGIRRRPLQLATQQLMMRLGMICLIVLMTQATINDLMRIL